MDVVEEIRHELNGKQYSDLKNLKDVFKLAKENDIVIVYGESDDLIEFRGAIYNESYVPGKVYLTKDGLYEPECLDEDCPHEERLRKSLPYIDAIWSDGSNEYSWSYESCIPHWVFEIHDEDMPYCKGIIFRLSDIPNSI